MFCVFNLSSPGDITCGQGRACHDGRVVQNWGRRVLIEGCFKAWGDVVRQLVKSVRRWWFGATAKSVAQLGKGSEEVHIGLVAN